MPTMDIGRVLMTEDAEIIRRHMELHRERLEERLADERAITERIEMLLVDAIGRRKRPRSSGAVDSRSDTRSPIRDGT
jgi:hypothetical protein